MQRLPLAAAPATLAGVRLGGSVFTSRGLSGDAASWRCCFAGLEALGVKAVPSSLVSWTADLISGPEVAISVLIEVGPPAQSSLFGLEMLRRQ